MKKFLPALIIFCLGYSRVPGQIFHPIQVKESENIFEKLGSNIFLYPYFLPGVVVFKNNVVNQSRFNYNLLYGAIQFVNAKGDTLSMINADSVRFVKIAQDTFFYNEGYLQLVTGNKNAKLAIKQVLKVISEEKVGAYGGSGATGAITSYSNYSTPEFQNLKLDLRRDLVFDKIISFYISDKDGNFFKANRKNLLKAFPEKQKELEKFIRDNNTNFNHASDLISLVSVLK